MPVQIKKSNTGKIVATKAHTKKEAGNKQVDIDLPKHTEEHFAVADKGDSQVTVDLGRVWSDGNYGSYRVGVSVQLPANANTLDDVYKTALEFADAKMKEMLKGSGAE